MKKIRVIIIVFLAVIIFTALYFYNKNYHVDVKARETMYLAYPSDTTIYQSIFAIEGLNNENVYRAFYEPNSSVKYANFESYVFHENDLVYVLGYSEDSVLVNVAYYNNKGGRVIPPYIELWVHTCLLKRK